MAWEEDADAGACRVCARPFTVVRRRHHCHIPALALTLTLTLALALALAQPSPGPIALTLALTLSPTPNLYPSPTPNQVRRRHHCRACGKLVCEGCSRGRHAVRGARG